MRLRHSQAQIVRPLNHLMFLRVLIPIHEFVPKLAENPNFGTKEKFIALATNGNNNYATSIN